MLPARALHDLIGKKARIHYENGMEFEMEYVTDKELRWTATGGPTAGSSGSERLHATPVARGIYFLSWLESNGVSVSQIVDLSARSVMAFATFDTDDGRGELVPGRHVRVPLTPQDPSMPVERKDG